MAVGMALVRWVVLAVVVVVEIDVRVVVGLVVVVVVNVVVAVVIEIVVVVEAKIMITKSGYRKCFYLTIDKNEKLICFGYRSFCLKWKYTLFYIKQFFAALYEKEHIL